MGRRQVFFITCIMVGLMAYSMQAPTTAAPKIDCPEGMEYHECGTACPATCLNPEAPRCMGACVSACYCTKNMVWHENTCIPLYECPGRNNGNASRNNNRNSTSISGRVAKEGKVLIWYTPWDLPQQSTTNRVPIEEVYGTFTVRPTRKPINPRYYPRGTGVPTWYLLSPYQEDEKKSAGTSDLMKKMAVLQAIMLVAAFIIMYTLFL
ncbi:SCO-spondin-like [Uloborus diversus]|uniref:SCO-spondin-like n=1 Tax=Uloborus diversus TaxID=327109 RepID=UPI002409D11C|nr:SCO-spondin-like [Uloborus diversus]